MDKDQVIATSKKFETPYGPVYINVTAKHIGIRLSGGFDSAVMLYMLAQAITESGSDAEIHPLTVCRKNSSEFREWDRIFIYPHADSIIEWVRKSFPNVIIHNALKQDADFWWAVSSVNGRNISSYTESAMNLSRYLRWRFIEKRVTQSNGDEVLYCEYTGTTRNPPIGVLPQSEESHRDTISSNSIELGSPTVINIVTSEEMYIEPFRNADKRVTFWLATHLDILDTALKLSRSCEGGAIETRNFSRHCGECWWCLEREWGYRSYVPKQD